MGSLEDRKIGMLNIRIRILLVFMPSLFASWRFRFLKAGSRLAKRPQIEKNEFRKKNPSKIELAALRHPALRKV
ncbi:hypothetical protein HMPREF1986_01190 [Oribacterium sp. oral taxon 078 str. F0263]|nr:hypothetical protein HMPREF1986_01190 [Oribacterium sp. oral taxon 078 str. F0263]